MVLTISYKRKMLKKILNPSSCAKCRICCGFDREDIWETPVVTDELKEYLEKNKIPTELIPFKSEYKFKTEFKDGEELSFCPMLTPSGCLLKDNKPFDCRVWPFRAMKLSDKLYCLTVSPVCKTVSDMPLSTLSDFAVKELKSVMREYTKNHPDAIPDYIADYPILDVWEK